MENYIIIIGTLLLVLLENLIFSKNKKIFKSLFYISYIPIVLAFCFQYFQRYTEFIPYLVVTTFILYLVYIVLNFLNYKKKA
ncbi:MAG: hypothetical protein KatS3mg027_1939 [Bacteroidia bacterium]|nr:MAG: hypothetical protein KatS3mg027_1939 [Bacteroidia bacterium]